ncbi:hypothetical protein NPIL_335401 [Nephila pilipes]|uniref:Uncharacterized protein n=1 Tax=Nephila pilipes TaxID=299642 RepID=A0A8X6JWP7_NEPPI|nr:hypothetical protein NPIL_335401 [Nephila pilipes]
MLASPTDGAAADIARRYTVGRERDALRFAGTSTILQLPRRGCLANFHTDREKAIKDYLTCEERHSDYSTLNIPSCSIIIQTKAVIIICVYNVNKRILFLQIGVQRFSHVDGRELWKIVTSPTDGAAADITQCYTVGRERDDLRLTNRRLLLTFSSHEGDAR